METDAPVSLVTGSYRTRDGAVEDFGRIWGTRYGGQFHHTALAVLTRVSGRELRVERVNSTAKHLAWGEHCSAGRCSSSLRLRAPRCSPQWR
jgi:hypothetical protein